MGVCTQKWIMEKNKVTGAGNLREEGTIKLDEDSIQEQQGPDEIYDESGNKIDVKKNKAKDPKELKKAIKDIEKKIKDNKKKNTLSEDELWELQDRLDEFKKALEVSK